MKDGRLVTAVLLLKYFDGLNDESRLLYTAYTVIGAIYHSLWQLHIHSVECQDIYVILLPH